MKGRMRILKGPGSSGKSTTIKATFDSFLKWAIKYPQKQKALTVHYLYLNDREVAAVVKVGKESIGIATRGDTRDQVMLGLNFFADHQCKIVLCATRSSGESLDAAIPFAKEHRFEPTEVLKLKINGIAAQQEANLEMSKKLKKWLVSACS